MEESGTKLFHFAAHVFVVKPTLTGQRLGRINLLPGPRAVALDGGTNQGISSHSLHE